ncbi:hypothetical protein ACFY30_03195 [Streptomyces sp. NPDC000345]|uniref:hypothetical protein n=1 Tax=Streptomyces sp. NPDC000345 TaxID=3364537 RepID=UPI00368F1C98
MRHPLRTGLLGVAVTVLGYALFAAWLGVHAGRYLDARDRATARTAGVIVEDGIGDEEDVRVRWTDGDGHLHVQRFGVYDTGRYGKGEDFPVAYDPAADHPRGFPADPDETAEEDDLVVPVFLGAAVALPLTLVWLWRGLRFRLTARRPGRPMTARVRVGTRRASWRAPTATWLELSAPEGRHWQRVMWHPALHEPPAELPVTVHGAPPGSRRPAVPVLPDGTRLVPLGRLRERPPAAVLFHDDETVRADLRDAFVLPPGAAVHPVPAWHAGLRTAAAGAALGTVVGLVMTHATLTGTVAVALSCTALVTSVWTLSAPQP